MPAYNAQLVDHLLEVKQDPNAVVCLVTNSSTQSVNVLSTLYPFLNEVDHVFAGYDQLAKPHPFPYQQAFDVTRPTEIIGYEDKPNYDKLSNQKEEEDTEVKEGFHKMPDGSIMADEDMKDY